MRPCLDLNQIFGGPCALMERAKSTSGHPHQHGACAIRLREKSKFASHIKLIWVVQSLAQKYSAFVFPKFMIDCSYSAPTQGSYRDRHERGAECGGRRPCR